MISKQCSSDFFKFFTFPHKFLIDSDNVVGEDFFEGLDSLPPNGFDFCKTLDPDNINDFRHWLHEIRSQNIV